MTKTLLVKAAFKPKGQRYNVLEPEKEIQNLTLLPKIKLILQCPKSSTTGVLTATTLIYAIGAGITAAAGTRLALQLFLVNSFNLYSFQFYDPKGPRSLFIVTTSLYQDWVICAPAAFLGCGSRFSGSLSGIEPLFPVTRKNHGKPLPYHRKLIGQKFL